MKKFFGNLYIVIIMLFLYLPILTLIVLSFNEAKSMSVFTRFSLKWYGEMFHSKLILGALVNTFSIALLAALIATIIGTMAVIGIDGMKQSTQMVLMGCNNIPMLNADIVTGIALMLSFLMFGISLGYCTILFSHITFCIPYVILSVRPRMNKATDTCSKRRWTWALPGDTPSAKWCCRSFCRESHRDSCFLLPCPSMIHHHPLYQRGGHQHHLHADLQRGENRNSSIPVRLIHRNLLDCAGGAAGGQLEQY